MKLGLLLDIAKSLMLARFRQTMVAAVGVTFSITMFITLLSFMAGLNDMLDNLILNRTPHVRLYREIHPSKIQPIENNQNYKQSYHFIRSIKPKNERQEIYNSGQIIQTLEKDSRVKGIAPKNTIPVFYNSGAVSLTGIINGVDVEAEAKLFKFQDYVVDGHTNDLKNTPNSIFLGIGAAKKMMVQVGDIVSITNAKGELFPLKVVGFFQSGIDELDKVHSYTTLVTSQKIMEKPSNYVTDIQLKLNDLTIAPELAKEYAALFDIDAIDIQTANSQF